MAFHPSLSKLYCGCSSFIEIIDLASSSSTRLKTTFTKSSKDGQKGIISALAFAPGATGDFVAAGFDGSVGMYTEDGELEGWLGGVEGGGVTQLSYHPLNPALLFVASRRSDVIQVYDLHNPSQPLHILPRKGRTNQRLRFDIDVWGRWLASGDEVGSLFFYFFYFGDDGMLTSYRRGWSGFGILSARRYPLCLRRSCIMVGPAYLVSTHY